MDRIEQLFAKTKPFIGYLTGGDGGLEATIASALALIKGGVEMLEIGFPFSDPIADGPVIQRAHERALHHKTTASTILKIARAIREQHSDIPLVLFSYFNPLFQRGESYLKQLKEAGFDALLIVDLALTDHSRHFFDKIKKSGLAPILLATPSTTPQRLEMISQVAEGFLYYVLQKGTTGIRNTLPADFSIQIQKVRPFFKIPLIAGFGIADRASAQSVLEVADGFVVGSAFVKKIEEGASPEELTAFAQLIKPSQVAFKKD